VTSVRTALDQDESPAAATHGGALIQSMELATAVLVGVSPTEY
jgi:hypothetical protein